MKPISASLKERIESRGMPLDKVSEQLDNFEKGFPYLDIQSAATIGNGIRKLSDSELSHFMELYDKHAPEKEIYKFVPASGAASRMFKDLFSFVNSDVPLDKDDFTKKFITHLRDFAFSDDLDEALKQKGSSLEAALEKKQYKLIVNTLLNDNGLEYGSLPKGLLKFHRYEDETRTPTQEHFVEGAQYGVGRDHVARLHFTVSPEHQERFEKHVTEIRPQLEKKFDVKFEISFSRQKKSTDTIAVNPDNTPFEEEDGSLLFRPSGHGALLENLNDINADLIFIKNIDNVVPDRLKNTSTTYKKAIGGVLLEVQSKIFEALQSLEHHTDGDLAKAEDILKNELSFEFNDWYKNLSYEDKKSYLRKKLNRPVRVCGMVKNTGEPGGGPFWVKEENGMLSLQIGETAQLDPKSEHHQTILQSATHFNPTDLVCGVKNYKGQKFDLLKYRDPKTGFITKKSKDGKDLKAQELPGLWNGSMADWSTVFVEVPLITFNPVKTINDLLREEHQ